MAALGNQFCRLGRQPDVDQGRNPAIDHTVVVVLDGRIFPWLGAEKSAFRRSAAAKQLGSERSIQPRRGRPVKSIPKNKSLAAAVPDDGKQKSRFVHLRATRRGGGRQASRRHSQPL